MVMMEKLDFNPGEIEIPIYLNEGDLTVDNDAELANGTDTSWNFDPAKKIHKHDKVVIDITNNQMCKKATGGETELLGEIIDNPKWNGTRPPRSANFGDYKPRVATVRLYGSFVKSEALAPSNGAIYPGQSIKPGSLANTVDLYDDTNKNNTRTLSAAVSNAGGNVIVIYGFYGNFE